MVAVEYVAVAALEICFAVALPCMRRIEIAAHVARTSAGQDVNVVPREHAGVGVWNLLQQGADKNVFRGRRCTW